MTRTSQDDHRPLDGPEWPARGSIRVLVESAGMVLALDDLDIVDPLDHFWTPLAVDTSVNGVSPRQHIPQTATLLGDVDGVPWSATAQSERIKRVRRRGQYEGGWTKVVSLEVGAYAIERGVASVSDFRQWISALPAADESPDVLDLIPRATYAARGALLALETAREYVSAVRSDAHLRSDLGDFPIRDTSSLPPAGQVSVVARIHNLSTMHGYRNQQARVEQATGLSESTAKRRIGAARRAGLITTKKRGTK